MYELNLKKGIFPVIIKPNLGQPILINLRDFKENETFTKRLIFDGLLIAIPGQKINEILQYFQLNIFIQPILEDEGDFKKRRGEKYPLQIIEIDKIKDLDFREQGVLEEENCIIWDIFNSLLQVNAFGKRKELYKIKFQIKRARVIDDLLKKLNRSSLLFDLIHDIPNKIESKINYHAIAIFDKDWKDFKFIHSSDFHVARRNDFISKFLKDNAKDKYKRCSTRKILTSKKLPFILTRDFEFKKGIDEERLEELRHAKYNFNYNLRLLIKEINERVKKNELDFVLMTGDLVDYINIGRGNYQYKNNFHVFIEILLGLNRGLNKYPFFTDKEHINKKEILAPIFTIVGNHDYRKGHYSLRVGRAHNSFGITHNDVKGYYDIKFFNYFTAIRSRDKYIRDYFIYFNPNLNYKVKIGNEYCFIFLETGHDSIADLHDLLKGAPSSKGLKDYQIDLLRAYIKLAKDDKIIVVMHTPPVSPSLGALKQRKYKKIFKLKRQLKWSDFYEENLKGYTGNSRLDKIVNLKYQTIMFNWKTFLRICTGSDKIIRRKMDLVLCGHTHTLKEFRLKEARETESVNYGFLFFPYHVKVPCEIYTSLYREKFNSFKDPMDLKIWFDINKPFIFQTQAVGPISLKYKFKPPGYRYYTIKNNQVVQIEVYSLHLKDIIPES